MRSSNTCSPFQIYKRQNTVDKVITCNSYKKWTGRVIAPIDVKIFKLYLLAARFWLGSDNISVLSMSGHQFCSAQSSIVQTFGESHGLVGCQFIQQNGLLSVMRGFYTFLTIKIIAPRFNNYFRSFFAKFLFQWLKNGTFVICLPVRKYQN